MRKLKNINNNSDTATFSYHLNNALYKIFKSEDMDKIFCRVDINIHADYSYQFIVYLDNFNIKIDDIFCSYSYIQHLQNREGSLFMAEDIAKYIWSQIKDKCIFINSYKMLS